MRRRRCAAAPLLLLRLPWLVLVLCCGNAAAAAAAASPSSSASVASGADPTPHSSSFYASQSPRGKESSTATPVAASSPSTLGEANASGVGGDGIGATVGDASKKQGAYGKVRVHKEPALSQLLRVDEMVAAYMLLYVRPLQSNLQQSHYVQHRYPASDLHFCNDMLERVSRSFAAVIQQLPETLLVDVLVFYLVLRALDTIEDDTTLDPNVKIKLLQSFAKDALVQNEDGSSWRVNDIDIGEGDERVLLQQFSRVHSVFQRLPSHSQQVIVDITDRMANGMASYVNQDFRQGTANLDEYNLYCHYVAGLVGEGLSRLFAASRLESDPVFASEDQFLSNQMGLFLQKTNIIRDYLEDYVDGRAFWPRSVWKKYSDSGDLGYFVLQHDPYVRKQSLQCLNELVTDALELVPDCLLYMSKLRCQEIFRFCAIPQVMAIATLEKCFGNLDVFTGVVKIRKGLSCKLILGSSTSLSHVHEAFHQFAHRIAAKAKRVRSGDDNDPVRERTLQVCNTIRDLSQARTMRLQRARTFTTIAWVLLGFALVTPSTLDRNVCLAGATALFVAVHILKGLHNNVDTLIEASVLERQLGNADLAVPHVA